MPGCGPTPGAAGAPGAGAVPGGGAPGDDAIPGAGYGDGTIRFAYTRAGANGLEITDEETELPADQVLTAIGQVLATDLDLATEGRKLAVDDEGRTSAPGIWAAGDCTPGEDLTVVAVAEGRDAAESIHRALSA